MKAKLLTICTLLLAAGCTRTPVKNAGINYAYMDTTVRAGDDFARYATGHWAELNPQPKEYPMWGTVGKVQDDNIKALAALIQDIAAGENKKGSIEQKIA